MVTTSNTAEHRRRLRALLEGDACIHPATVYDPISARLAEMAGYEVAVLPGSLASAAILGVPDLILITLTEFAEQARRIARYSGLAVVADADHGYGNALNAQRTVEELEAAGVAGLTLEDTLLPAPYNPTEPMISIPEMSARLRAAVEARSDPSLVIVARTNALNVSTVEDAIERLTAYQQTGVDAVMIVGASKPEQVGAVGGAVSLPVILGNVPASEPQLADRAFLAAHRVRIAYQNQPAFLASVQAQYDVMRHLHEGGTLASIAQPLAPGKLVDEMLRRTAYDETQQRYLKGEVKRS